MLAAIVLVGLVGPSAAQAAYPGQNGKIAYVRAGDIWTMDADGSNQTNITNTAGMTESHPVWSPDGTQIAFVGSPPSAWPDVWSMNANGSNPTNLTDSWVPPCGPGCQDVIATAVTWSPDGTELAFTNFGRPGDDNLGCLATVDADGTDVTAIPTCPPADNPNTADTWDAAWSPDGSTILLAAYDGEPDIWAYDITSSAYVQVTHRPISRHPSWSPSAQQVVFDRDDGLLTNNYFAAVMDADGTSVVDIAGPYTTEPDPAWSPDGTRIAARIGDDIYAMNPNGGGQVNLTNTAGAAETQPDWQPIPINGYPRPKAASPQQISLVPAYQQCTASNRTHGPPLAFSSCNPPVQSTGQLTVGTPDANGPAANSVGSVRLAAVGELPIDPNNGDQSDVNIKVNITDVRNASGLTDYTGNLTVKIGRRITDKDNTPHPGGPGAATTEDNTFSFAVPCTATGSTTVGATCSLTTSADTLVPGTVLERKRAIWALDRVTVRDGADAPFLTQGIFIP